MRALQIILALFLAVILFLVLRLLGLFLKFALIAAAVGFVAGLMLWYLFSRAFRQRSI